MGPEEAPNHKIRNVISRAKWVWAAGGNPIGRMNMNEQQEDNEQYRSIKLNQEQFQRVATRGIPGLAPPYSPAQKEPGSTNT